MTVLATTDLAKDYGDGLGIQPTTIAVDEGELVLLVGPNGAGKSTFLGLCSGVLEPTGGTVQVLDHDAGSPEARAATSVLLDHPVLYDDLSVREHAEYVARLHGVDDWSPTTEHLMERLGIEARGDDLPSRFSRGLRQKTSLVLGLVRPFHLLLIDEPFVGLDVPGQQELVVLLEEAARNGAAVVVSSHQLDLADRATRCVGLRDGEVVHDGESSADVVRRLVSG